MDSKMMVFYDGVQRILFVGVEQRHLTKQIGFLFEAFLNATDYQLTNDELMTLLWPNQSGTPDRLASSSQPNAKSAYPGHSYREDISERLCIDYLIKNVLPMEWAVFA